MTIDVLSTTSSSVTVKAALSNTTSDVDETNVFVNEEKQVNVFFCNFCSYQKVHHFQDEISRVGTFFC